MTTISGRVLTICFNFMWKSWELRSPAYIILIIYFFSVQTRHLILELCLGSLEQVFLHPNDPLKYTGPKLPHYFKIQFQLAIGLEYIHSKNLIYHFVKPANVLISGESSTNITMKWADFGLSRMKIDFEVYKSHHSRHLNGTQSWTAPELLIQHAQNPCGHHYTSEEMSLIQCTMKSDIFCLGLIFAYYLNNGKHPFGSNSTEVMLNIIQSVVNLVDSAEILGEAYATILKTMTLECKLS